MLNEKLFLASLALDLQRKTNDIRDESGRVVRRVFIHPFACEEEVMIKKSLE